MKILVVEDNTKLLDSIVKELEKHFQVESTSNGEEAYYLIKQNIYDLVVLDLMLPGMDGIQILEGIRKTNEDILVLILTAKESVDDKVKAFMIGANDYLTKPFYMEELVARIYAMLRTKGKLDNKNTLEFKDLKLDLNKKRLL
ncbi:response regulator [[Clostridium] sordellii ATCC 9714]|nr:response regulator [[Clostridium] sordellii ATCC 9714] [Paeniclostridium sordellii ATCC 9714]